MGMLIKIIVVGKPKDKVLGMKSAEFVSRCGAYGKVECVELPDSDVAREGKMIMRELEKEKNSFVFVLSEEGKLFSTADLARKIAAIDRKMVFIIGGPFGIAPEVKAHADILWSLSPLTFTHEMARFLLCEQLYRMLNFNAGGSYHHI